MLWSSVHIFITNLDTQIWQANQAVLSTTALNNLLILLASILWALITKSQDHK